MQRIGVFVARVVGLIGVVVLVGWQVGIRSLTTVVPGYVSMKPNTALGLIAIAVAVTTPGRPWVRKALGTAVVMLGAGTLVEYGTGRDLGVDLLLPWLDPRGDAVRMAPASAFSFVLLGAAVLATTVARGRLTRGLALSALAVGYTAVLGYAYGVSSLYSIGGYTQMALHTALSMILLALALLLQQPREGLVGLVADRGSAGRMSRPLIPLFLVVPGLLGWARLQAQQAGYLDTAFGVATLVMSMIVLGIAVTWGAALRLRVGDGERDLALAQLAQTNRELDATVLERTQQLQLAVNRLDTLIAEAPVGVVQLDASGGLLTANDQWRGLTGLTDECAAGHGWAAAVHPDDVERVASEWAARAPVGEVYETTLRYVKPDGQLSWVQARTVPIRERGTLVGHLAVVTDVTALHVASAEASAARALFEAAFESSPLGTAIVDEAGFVRESNSRMSELLGQPVDGRRIEEFFTVERDDLRKRCEVRRVERRVHRYDGTSLWVAVSAARIGGDRVRQGWVYELEDITAQRQAEARLAHLALHDSLTDLPNRTLLLDRLSQALHQGARYGEGVGVLFIDLDGFKNINDTHGHQAGDAVLLEVARRLSAGSRAADTVARLGGDEFVVVCPGVSLSGDLLDLAETLRLLVVEPIGLGEGTVSVGASVGLAIGVGHEEPERLLRDADEAMYRAKRGGRSRRALFDDGLRARRARRLDLAADLRSAVDLGQVEPWFQPIVDLDRRQVVAVEALARWRRTAEGLVPPAEFIEVAEEAGLISDLGASMLLRACTAAAADPAGPAVSVNVSAHQFVGQDFGAVVERALDASGLPPDRLWLELTESAVVEAVGSAARTFQSLRARGVKLAIDDFGAGYSSFGSLRTFDVDIVKIDRSFITGLAGSAHDRALVSGMVRLADSLGFQIVAEGIETTAQRDVVRELACHLGQGYLFARPSPIIEPVVAFHGLIPASRSDASPADSVSAREPLS